MLYPRINEYRQVMDLGGFWDFRADAEDVGSRDGWAAGFTGGVPLAVPASWNDQLPGLRDFLGPAWYSTSFRIPDAWRGGRLLLRLDSVNYLADVWLNGKALGAHEGGHLPFSFDVTSVVKSGANLLVVRVDGALAPDRVPPGEIPGDPLDAFQTIPPYPNTAFDFFPFCGIHRPVRLCCVPPGGIEDVRVTTALHGAGASVSVRLTTGCGPAGSSPITARLRISGHGTSTTVDVRLERGDAAAEIPVSAPALWSCESPDLYDLEVSLLRNGEPFDAYTLPVGIRSIEVKGDQILLNGKPVYLKGFGRHEDFPVTGRGLVPAVIIRDYDIMRWTGANSFRTTHYPYSEEMMDMADRLGFLVIDEIPAVGLFFREPGLERRAALCSEMLRELIERDGNRPSVIAWSLANEPHSRAPQAKAFFRTLFDEAKARDPTRPVTMVSHVGVDEEAFTFCDFACLNRYYGWYTQSGQIDAGCAKLAEELDAMHARFRTPIVVSEFGTDTMPGVHADPPEMFSEEYQALFIERYIQVMDQRPWVVGAHVWNLCDFKTGQAVRRPGSMNYKGVFTRDRRPKMAAHTLRRIWGGR